MCGCPETKGDLKTCAMKASQNDRLGFYEIDNTKIYVIKCNGAVGLEFGSEYDRVNVGTLTSSRYENFLIACNELIKKWCRENKRPPDAIARTIENLGKCLKDLQAYELLRIVQTGSNGYVLHENLDMYTISLVPRNLHDVNAGGISHYGGYALAKYYREYRKFPHGEYDLKNSLLALTK